MRLQDLAEGDTHELVASVQETYADFIALESHHAIVPLPRPYLALSPLASYDYGASTSDVIARLTEGVASLALALRRRFAVRYQKNSETAANLARSLHHLTNFEQRELFDFGNRPGEARPLLLILDRKDDPITPLLTQWTYQAMLHDILGLEDNRCSLRHVLGIRPELAEAVVSPSQDAFFKANMYANFGDAGMAVKQMVDAMGAETTNRNQPRDFQSIEDMASFVEALPDVTAQQGLTAKHVTLMTELSHAVENRQLMQVSGVEQEIACQTAAPERHFDAAAALIRSPAVRPFDKARLAALYALRYEGSSQASVLLAACADEGVDAQTMAALRAVAKYCGSETRVMDLFSDRSFTSRMATLAKQHLKGVEVSEQDGSLCGWWLCWYIQLLL
jgi:vacuolar protein sorting-associated protein 45